MYNGYFKDINLFIDTTFYLVSTSCMMTATYACVLSQNIKENCQSKTMAWPVLSMHTGFILFRHCTNEMKQLVSTTGKLQAKDQH